MAAAAGAGFGAVLSAQQGGAGSARLNKCIELAPTSMAAIRMGMPAAEHRAPPALGHVRRRAAI